MLLFDSLGHPTVSGRWKSGNPDCSFAAYSAELRANGFQGGLAVGISGLEDYEHTRFAEQASGFPNLFPVAGFNPQSEPLSTLGTLRELGYVGVKIHPRWSGLDLGQSETALVATFRECERIGLPVLFCTYLHCHTGNHTEVDLYHYLIRLLKQVPNTKVVLVHGGVTELLKYAELVRFNRNLLLDLSLTWMKYAGSSIDLDVKFLFQQFDQRICIGSDHPEYSLEKTRRRFEEFTAGLPSEKIANVGYRNITEFLGIEA